MPSPIACATDHQAISVARSATPTIVLLATSTTANKVERLATLALATLARTSVTKVLDLMVASYHRTFFYFVVFFSVI